MSLFCLARHSHSGLVKFVERIYDDILLWADAWHALHATGRVSVDTPELWPNKRVPQCAGNEVHPMATTHQGSRPVEGRHNQIASPIASY